MLIANPACAMYVHRELGIQHPSRIGTKMNCYCTLHINRPQSILHTRIPYVVQLCNTQTYRSAKVFTCKTPNKFTTCHTVLSIMHTILSLHIAMTVIRYTLQALGKSVSPTGTWQLANWTACSDLEPFCQTFVVMYVTTRQTADLFSYTERM